MPAAPGFSQTVGVNFATDTTSFLNSIQGAIERLKGFNFWAIAAGSAIAGFAFSALQAATEEVMAFENALVELRKVAGTAVAEQAKSSIREMATVMPIARERLMAIATEFGRAGVSSNRFLSELTRVAAEMSVATDVMSGEAVRAIIKLQGAMGLGRDTARQLGASINALANNLVTSSSEIVQSAIRSSAALSNLGASADQVLALNAAFIRVSPSARRAGTRIRRVAEELQAMSEEDLNELAKAMGVATEDLADMIEERPIDAIQRVGSVSQSIARELNNIFGTRVTNAFQNLGNVIGDVEFAMGIANKQFQEASSLQEEYKKAMETASAQMTILNNKFEELQLSVGEGALPVVRGMIKGGKDFVGMLNNLSSGLGDATAAVSVFAAGIAGLGIAVAGLLNPLAGLAVAAGVTGVAGSLAFFGGEAITAAQKAQEMREEMKKTEEAFQSFNKETDKFTATSRTLEKRQEKITQNWENVSKAIRTAELDVSNYQDALEALREGGGAFNPNEFRQVDKINEAIDFAGINPQELKKDFNRANKFVNNFTGTLERLVETGIITEKQFGRLRRSMQSALSRISQASENLRTPAGIKNFNQELQKMIAFSKEVKNVVVSAQRAVRQEMRSFVETSENLTENPRRLIQLLSREPDFFEKQDEQAQKLESRIEAVANAMLSMQTGMSALVQGGAFFSLAGQIEQSNKQLQELQDNATKRALQDWIDTAVQRLSRFPNTISLAERSFTSLIEEQMTLKRVMNDLEKAKDQAFDIADNKAAISPQLAAIQLMLKSLEKRYESIQDVTEMTAESTEDWKDSMKQTLGVAEQSSFAMQQVSRKASEVRDVLRTLGRTKQLKEFNQTIKKTVNNAKNQEAAIKGVREQLKKLNIDALKTKAQIVELNREFQKAGGTISIAESEFQKMRTVMDRIAATSPNQVKFWRQEVDALVKKFRKGDISESQFLTSLNDARESMELWNPELQQFRDTFENVMTDIVMTGEATSEDMKDIGRAMAKNIINHFFKNFLAKKMSAAIASLAQAGIRAVAKGIGAKTGPVSGGKGTGEGDLVTQLIGSVVTAAVGGVASAGGSAIAGAFGDTPGIMEMRNGGTVRLAEGDKFAASQSLEGLKSQVNRMESNQGQTVVVEQHNTFTVDVQDEVRRQISQTYPQIEKMTKQAVKEESHRSLNTQNQIKGN
jgi:TP901 family phage tail tape measure protein